MKEKLRELTEWVCTLYGFIIKGKGEISGIQFSELIDERFVCEPYEPYLRNYDEAKHLVARQFAETCIKSISVRMDGQTKCTCDFSRITSKNLIEWGL